MGKEKYIKELNEVRCHLGAFSLTQATCLERLIGVLEDVINAIGAHKREAEKDDDDEIMCVTDDGHVIL